MAPKAKQIARRARAQGKGKGFEGLDSDYEKELFDQLPLQVRKDVVDVAQVLMNTYDGMPLDIAMPSANRIRREQRDVFDRILNMQRAMEEAIETVLLQHEDFVDEELRARGYVVSHLDQNNAQALTGMDQNNVLEPIFAKGKGKGKGFEPFSGKGRRLDDLNSLD